jgi:hypothetical protein
MSPVCHIQRRAKSFLQLQNTCIIKAGNYMS